jgi:malonyl CoA-acyl carrier protein transacylase
MNEAAKDVNEFLDGINIEIPRVNVYSNYTGKPHAFRTQKIKRDLVRQITNPIKWEQISQHLFEKRKVF